MPAAGDGAHGRRLRALIVVLWRAGLRIRGARPQRVRSRPRRGSLLVRRGKGGRRREVGMDEWAWEQLQPWSAVRLELPVGPLFCVIHGPGPRATVVSGGSARRPTCHGLERRRASPLRAPPAPPRACGRDGPRGRAADRHPAPARSQQPRASPRSTCRASPRSSTPSTPAARPSGLLLVVRSGSNSTTRRRCCSCHQAVASAGLVVTRAGRPLRERGAHQRDAWFARIVRAGPRRSSPRQSGSSPPTSWSVSHASYCLTLHPRSCTRAR